MRKGCTLLLNIFFTKIQPMTELQQKQALPCTNNFREKRLYIMASCMTNLSEFYNVFLRVPYSFVKQN